MRISAQKVRISANSRIKKYELVRIRELKKGMRISPLKSANKCAKKYELVRIRELKK